MAYPNQKQQKHHTVQEALKKAMAYCAYQDRCHKEVLQKLRNLGQKQTAQDHILGQLIADGFLNEERFARSFTRGKFNNKQWGRLRIVRELKARDLSAYNIKFALAEIEAEYLTHFEKICTKKWEETAHLPLLKRKKKVFDYLNYRGWEPHLIYEGLNSLEA
ncbi:regulatory protein RecX [Sediminicola luteus]|uniref:Regulatory protein RecX n=1 Tax=Sediminicola luteus TaxID=319238 RepID=A0A2A4G291_9FLAO|nr:regulatory protein RecX [Sediminicola luteus]PCE62797.1 recombinase RecX [Sediminicola luteus]